MSAMEELAYEFIEALGSNEEGRFERVLAEDVGMRLARWDGSENYRPRHRVIRRLMEEWSAWPDAKIEIFTVTGDSERAAIEFRIQATENGTYVEHNRSMFVSLENDCVKMIDYYCPLPLPSAHRQDWIAPATISEEALKRLLSEKQYDFDVREWIPPDANWRLSPQISMGGSGGAHPASNGIDGAHLSEEEVDARIEQIIDSHRDRGIGFHWAVSSFDRPHDLGERLEAHGMMMAGYAAKMARVGLDNLDDIPINPNVDANILDGTSDEDIEAVMKVTQVSFRMPEEEAKRWKDHMYERIREPKFREEELMFLAKLDGAPAGTGRVSFKGGTAHLTGGATLPEYRGKKIYSTLLKRRLEEARARGYHVATIDAGPMSKRVVEKYGFKEYGWTRIYGWMPVMDAQVIRSLVPDD